MPLMCTSLVLGVVGASDRADAELMRIRGHFKQSETPEAREELRLKMEAKEEARAKAAKKALEEFEENRKK